MSSTASHNKTRKNVLPAKPQEIQNSESRTNCCFWLIFALMTCVKLLLVPTYHSTDFEVHRNWLAITHSLPISEWYINAKSQWTLDYPPFFAWFEYFLSQFAWLFDSQMLRVDNVQYTSFATKIFQRSTVMATDIVYAYAIKEAGKAFGLSDKGLITMGLLTLANIGLLVVDHVHFQYNGFLLGILVLSLARISRISEESQLLQGAFWFACLLNLKHLYVYVAPAFGVWLLRCYCFRDERYLIRIVKLGIIVSFTLVVSFGPFVHQLPQVLSRLFPFKRGLVHAYWAANAWAIYTGCDKVLSVIWKQFGWSVSSSTATMTSGLVQESVFSVLPSPTPLATFIITFASMLPALGMLLSGKSNSLPLHFARSVVLCGLTSFMFGWHVHEKAILTAIIPLSILAVCDPIDAKIFTILSSAGHTALLPLLYQANLAPLRILLIIIHIIFSLTSLNSLHGKSLLNILEKAYITGLPFLPIYDNVIHKLLFSERLPFLPLAMTSLYCAIGITYCWIYYYYIFLADKRDARTITRTMNK